MVLATGDVTIILSVCIAAVSVLIIIFALLLRFYNSSDGSNSSSRNAGKTRNTNSRGFNLRERDDEDNGFNGWGAEEQQEAPYRLEQNRERIYFARPTPQLEVPNIAPTASQQAFVQQQQQSQPHAAPQQLIATPQTQIPTQQIVQPIVQREVTFPGSENVLYAIRPGQEMTNFVQPVSRFQLPPVPQILPQCLPPEATPTCTTSPVLAAQNVTSPPKQQFVIVKTLPPQEPAKCEPKPAKKKKVPTATLR